jgi:hypothetical protein
MDKLIEGFSLLGIASLAVVIVVVVAATRRVLEFAFPVLQTKESTVKVEQPEDGKGPYRSRAKVVVFKSQAARFYKEVVLYLMPHLYACLFAIPNIEFIYGKSAETYGGRVFMALLVATFSGLFYKSVKKAIPGLFGVTVESASEKVFSIPPK